MSIKYNEYLLLELFNSEPLIIDREAEIYKYQIKGEMGFELTLYFSVYDQYATVRLGCKELKKPIFEVDMENVVEIRAGKEKISFFKQESQEPVFQVRISPSFMLDISL
ncbi:hypothetical protein SAMN04488112_1255 [Melghirimyces thermohalophilus]|uniref:Uncharacterized protein n=1 Tax=Melghirimyces thermohalophilus TaxID=1236220 RepID=A0A1G6QZ23_9BACL|nr:hypothetical protein [Melghirimyces thermohalophilus]SDC97511.1 hypothetical protein SAMN04488112_1255 [Melghirimyces thermohalophilus]